MATTLRDPDTHRTSTVPDAVAESYLSQGWVYPGTSAPAEPSPPAIAEMTVAELKAHAEERGIDLARAKLKADIRAVIDRA
ncbi:hypothetical protein [Microbacterium sp. LWO13-1.2]|uniref:hypothetical protein n=1 Tax=Microbacterium sp. LWO13-1.2 TaxID=3135262 RepID=UPI00313891F7